MSIRVECDWCKQAIPAGDRYVTIEIDGKIVSGHRSNEPEDVSGPARVYCALDRYDEDDPAARGMGIGGRQWGHRESCAKRVLAVLNGNPAGRVDMGMQWRLVPIAAPKAEWLIDAPVAVLTVSRRTLAALEKAGVETVHELARMTEAQWLGIRGIAKGGAKEILKALHRHEDVKPAALQVKLEELEAVAS